MMFNENGVTTTPTNRVTISELTPATAYRFRVSAITEGEERGAEVPISVTTAEATGGEYIPEVSESILNGLNYAITLSYLQGDLLISS